MSGPLKSLDRNLRAPAPPQRLATVRILVGAFATVYLIARYPVLADFASFPAERFASVGLAGLLTAPLAPGLVWGLWAAAVLCGAAFTWGLGYRFTGPLFALLFLWVTSYRNSWGMVFHSENLTALHLMALGACPAAADSLSFDARDRAPPAPSARHGWPLRLLCALTLVTYVLAGVAKLQNGGLPWLEGEILRGTIAHDALRKIQVGSIHSPLGAWLVQYSWPFPAIGIATIALELGAPLFMLGRGARRVWLVGVYLFHLGVLLTMAIAFPYPLSGVAFASFLPVERLWGLKPLRAMAGRMGLR